MAEVLSKQPRPRGTRLTMLTNAGGAAVLATDALIAVGGELTTLSRKSLDALDRFLPAHWSHGNPIDILGDADPERYRRATEIALADPNSDGLLVILAPQGMTNPADLAERLKPHAHALGKPLLASRMGEKVLPPAKPKGRAVIDITVAVRAITSLFTPECKGLTITAICDPGHGISTSGVQYCILQLLISVRCRADENQNGA
jgi:acyl-CoA synthetase (NDP forming)